MAFLYSRWLALSLSTRIAIAKELGIAKNGSTHVQDNVVVSDGYNIKTVEDALEAHDKEWDDIVARAEGRTFVEVKMEELPPEIKPVAAAIEAMVEPKKKTTRAATTPRKKGK